MRLSKSRIMSSLQCLKRVHLEVNAPGLARYSKATQAAFDVGHEVGDVAVRLYGGDEGIFIDYNGGSLGPALARTALGAALDCAEDWIGVADQDAGLDWRSIT